MRTILTGAVLGAVLLTAVGCGGGAKDEGAKYKDPGLGLKPLPDPGAPGAAPKEGNPAQKAGGRSNAAQ